MYLYSYLLNRKRCICINNVYSKFKNVNFGGTSRVYCWHYIIYLTVSLMISFLSSIKLVCIFLLTTTPSWFQTNKMIVNLEKIQVIIINKKKQGHTGESIYIDQKKIEASSSVNFLEVPVDDQLNLNLYISNICRSADQLHTAIRLWIYLNSDKTKCE